MHLVDLSKYAKTPDVTDFLSHLVFSNHSYCISINHSLNCVHKHLWVTFIMYWRLVKNKTNFNIQVKRKEKTYGNNNDMTWSSWRSLWSIEAWSSSSSACTWWSYFELFWLRNLCLQFEKEKNISFNNYLSLIIVYRSC